MTHLNDGRRADDFISWRNGGCYAAGLHGRKARDRKGTPVISVYEFDYDAAIQDCAYLKFEFYDEAWLDFVVSSRRGQKPWSKYDIVEGGVANDRVIDTVELYTIGILDKASALGKLSEHQPNHQICILNQEILDKPYFHRVPAS